MIEIKCDGCGTSITREEYFVMKSGANFKYTFGYGSEYDGLTIDVDLCERCLAEKFKEFL